MFVIPHVLFISSFVFLSYSLYPVIDLNIFISFVLTSCSVFFVSALVSAAYVIIGLTQVLYIRVLLSILINLFLQITSLSAPDIIDAFRACD
ncbi:hypothetical protein C0J52_27741 [Blattella germanica]|nr:hypothetical protein C0J52_27741 [Blattella germanica]